MWCSRSVMVVVVGLRLHYIVEGWVGHSGCRDGEEWYSRIIACVVVFVMLKVGSTTVVFVWVVVVVVVKAYRGW